MRGYTIRRERNGKQVTSFRMEDAMLKRVKARIKQLSLTMGEYIRNLITKDIEDHAASNS